MASFRRCTFSHNCRSDRLGRQIGKRPVVVAALAAIPQHLVMLILVKVPARLGPLGIARDDEFTPMLGLGEPRGQVATVPFLADLALQLADHMSPICPTL
ncbi:hypothetical protein XM52_22075 [Roseovarius indicus]|uniref:Uncharacterized protein n=1 Tax=Roseovarius indicus TaxID=540747 RepID=A0A0T5P3N2_9RHOB|nr:hypothetical protein XM52_22075 [Roseovarius indicus]